MYFLLHGREIDEYPLLAEQMFRLRAKIFREELRWVDGDGHEERDRYDALDPVYVLHTDPLGLHVYASGRLMPTSGPTLLGDVFGETVPDADFASPFVWEITRLCLDDARIRAHGRDGERMTILRSMHVAALEFGLSAGVDTYLANFDPLRLRMWRRMNVAFDIIGTSETFSTRVHLGLTECSPAVLGAARARLGLDGPLLSAPPQLARRPALEAA